MWKTTFGTKCYFRGGNKSPGFSLFAYLVTRICSKTIAVVFNFYFDMVCGALLTPPQSLKVQRKAC